MAGNGRGRNAWRPLNGIYKSVNGRRGHHWAVGHRIAFRHRRELFEMLVFNDVMMIK